MKDRLLESQTRQEEVQAHRRHEVPEFQICEEDDAEMNRINAKLLSDRKDEGHRDDRREDLHHHSNDDEKTVEDQQERDLAADLLGDDFKQPLRDLLIDEVVHQAKSRSKDHQDCSDQDHAALHDTRQITKEMQVPVNED